MDRNKIISLQRAEFIRAEQHDHSSKVAQVLVLAVGVASVVVGNPLALYALAIANLIFGGVWQYFAFHARKSHSIGEKARRAVMFNIGLGVKLTDKSQRELLASFTNASAAMPTDGDYYEDDSRIGFSRLASIVEESAFWSSHLFGKCAVTSWWFFILAVVIAAGVLLALPLLGQSGYLMLFAQMSCVVLTWLVAGSSLSSALKFQEGAKVAGIIEAKLANCADDPDVIVTASDYNSLVERMPTIPTKVYEANRDRLNQLWSERT